MYLKSKKIKCKNKQIKLSDNAVAFIKKYAMVDLKIDKPINEDVLSDIEQYCAECDNELADKELNPNYVLSDEQKCRIAGSIETEIYNALEDYIIDYDDLNRRLGLK